MGREVGGGFRMGNTCTPTVDSCQCMAKPIQYCKAIKINKFFKSPVFFHRSRDCQKDIYRLIVPAAEKAMASHSSTLAWKIPWMEEPGGLQSTGSRTVRYD